MRQAEALNYANRSPAVPKTCSPIPGVPMPRRSAGRIRRRSPRPEQAARQPKPVASAGGEDPRSESAEGLALRNDKLSGVSVERLMNLLTALDQDVEIVIRKKPRSRKAARISTVAA